MFVLSYSASATREAGAVVAPVEERKVAKYICTPHPSAFLLPSCSGNDWDFQFTHQGTPQGPRSTQAMGEEAATAHLMQRLSVAVQWGNCISVMGLFY